MALPYIDDELEEEQAEEAQSVEDYIPGDGTDIKIDFEAGDIVLDTGNPKEIDDYEALKQWVYKVLDTRAHIYEIYKGKDYGSASFEILMSDKPRAYRISQIQADIEEQLGKHPEIISVGDFNFEQVHRTLEVSFTVDTIYGNYEEVILI